MTEFVLALIAAVAITSALAPAYQAWEAAGMPRLEEL